MPSPVVLDVTFTAARDAASVPGAATVGERTLRVTRPVEVWFDGARVHEVRIPGALGDLDKLQLDPGGRFPDKIREDNVWPR